MKRFFYAAGAILAAGMTYANDPVAGTGENRPPVAQSETGAADKPASPKVLKVAPAGSTSDAAAQSDAAVSAPSARKENAMERAVSGKVRAALAAKGSEGTTATGPSAGSDIQVSTYHGVVTLKGKVNSDAEKQAIVDKVQTLNGVTIVKNELQVTTPGTDSVGAHAATDRGASKGGSRDTGDAGKTGSDSGTSSKAESEKDSK